MLGQSYEELLSKFSGSASLHLDFANFCEAVLNDPEKAAKYRQGAEILESGTLCKRLFFYEYQTLPANRLQFSSIAKFATKTLKI